MTRRKVCSDTEILLPTPVIDPDTSNSRCQYAYHFESHRCKVKISLLMSPMFLKADREYRDQTTRMLINMKMSTPVRIFILISGEIFILSYV